MFTAFLMKIKSKQKHKDFSSKPIYLREENRIKAHFLICFLTLLSLSKLSKTGIYNNSTF